MTDYEFTTNDFIYMDRGVLGALLALRSIRRLTSLRVFLALLSLCKWSITFSEALQQPVATIINNGELKLTSTEAYEQFGIHKSTFYAAIRDLVEHGLIVITRRGKGSGNRYAICNSRLYEVYRNRPDPNWRNLISDLCESVGKL